LVDFAAGGFSKCLRKFAGSTPVPGGTLPAMYKALVEQLEEFGIFQLDLQGRVLIWNRGAERLSGIAAADVISHPLSVVCTKLGNADKLDLILAHAAAGERYAKRCLCSKSATHVPGVLILEALRSDDGQLKGFVGILRELGEQEDDNKRLMHELAINAMIVVDAGGKIVGANRQTVRLFGYAEAELIGMPVEILVPLRFRANHPQSVRDFFAAPSIRAMGSGRDLFGRHKSGSEFPVEIALHPVETIRGRLAVASIIDITERKRAEHRFRLAVESAPNAMVMTDRQGRIVMVNVSTEKLFGYPREELIGSEIEILVPQRFRDRHPDFREAFFAQPATREMGVGRDLFGRHKDGSEFPVEVGLNPIETDEGMFVLAAIVDITQRRQSEDQMHKYLVESAHVARLTAVGEMVSGLAHEINQPLAAASNFMRASLRMARAQPSDFAPLVGWMEKAAEQTTRACDIVARFGAFVRKGGTSTSVESLNRLVEQATRYLPTIALNPDDVPVRLELELAPGDPKVTVDRVQIDQVLVNLVRNSVEAMQAVPENRRLLRILVRQEKHIAKVSVIDAGPGIEPTLLARLFEPFFTTKSNGMGLGLSISRSIIEAHDGELTVNSSVGQGSEFSFALPITEGGNSL
jgi:PAS domain S-box-containing protein